MGIVDNLILGIDRLVVRHQFKTAKLPTTFTIQTLLIDADGLLKTLDCGWQSLRKTDEGSGVEILVV